MKIVVIGSGFGGLSAAIRLQAQGHQVTIAQKRDKPGGRAIVYQQDGFTFDAGPTIITAPYLIHEFFELSNRTTSDYVTLVAICATLRLLQRSTQQRNALASTWHQTFRCIFIALLQLTPPLRHRVVIAGMCWLQFQTWMEQQIGRRWLSPTGMRSFSRPLALSRR
jgi:glycine/D-amino acid oxidase-like deaminating enzyme